MKLSDSRQLLIVVLILIGLLSVSAVAQEADVLIPANTKVSVQLLSPISTATAKPNDKFTCRVLTPAVYAGAIVEGHIRTAKRSGKANKESKIELGFDRIALADGRLANFNATVVEVFDVSGAAEQGRADNEGTVKNKSSTVKISAKRALMGAAIGAVIGGAIAGGQGAVIGAAIGASAGVTSTLAMKGEDLEFKTGTQLTVQTNGPTRRRALRTGENGIAVPATGPVTGNSSNKASGEETSVTSKGDQPSGVPVLKPRENAGPANPSEQTRLVTTSVFTVAAPDNWFNLGNKNPVTVAPEGGSRITNGETEITHGAMLGELNVGRKSLDEATDTLLAAALQRNSYLKQVGSRVTITIDGRPGLKTMLGGVGRDGKQESACVYTTLLRGQQLFYVITTVPEADVDSYTGAFQKLIESIKFTR
jgi:outer membrane lipoprotein SlyB